MRIFSFHRENELPERDRGKKFRVRTFRRGDRDRILEITRSAFGDVCYEACVDKHFGPIEHADWAERKARGIDSDLTYYGKSTFVAEVDGLVVGYVTTRLYHGYSTGHIANLAVDVPYQGQGIGRALTEWCLAFFRESGMKYARIETMDNNVRGQKLYTSLGFEEVGRQIHYFMTL